jgi:hypothetical protein
MWFLLSPVFSSIAVFSRYQSIDDTLVDVKIIPGTHNSGLIGISQIHSILEQLEMGVRFFDLKVSLNNDGVICLSATVEIDAADEGNEKFDESSFYHFKGADGKNYIRYYSKDSLETVLHTFKEWLIANPEEIIFPYIRTDPDTDGKEYKDQIDEILAKFEDLIYLPREPAYRWSRSSPKFVHDNLNLGMKGKVIFLHDDENCFKNGQGKCISWNIQNNFKITEPWKSTKQDLEDSEEAEWAALKMISEYAERPIEESPEEIKMLMLAKETKVDCREYNYQILEKVEEMILLDKEINLGAVVIDGATREFFEELLSAL